MDISCNSKGELSVLKKARSSQPRAGVLQEQLVCGGTMEKVKASVDALLREPRKVATNNF
jgi:hypothetical protein